MKKKIEFSKILLFILMILSIFITGLSTWFMVKYETYEPLVYVVPCHFCSLAATALYKKQKTRIKLKLFLVQ